MLHPRWVITSKLDNNSMWLLLTRISSTHRTQLDFQTPSSRNRLILLRSNRNQSPLRRELSGDLILVMKLLIQSTEQPLHPREKNIRFLLRPSQDSSRDKLLSLISPLEFLILQRPSLLLLLNISLLLLEEHQILRDFDSSSQVQIKDLVKDLQQQLHRHQECL